MIEKLQKPLLLKLFFLGRLPLVFFAGLRLEKINASECTASMPFWWMTKNPFRSMYFAAQSMAAEFSTAVLAVYYIERSNENVAMLITGMKAEFLKKATSRIRFICREGEKYKSAFDLELNNPDGFEVTSVSEGVDEEGEVVSRFHITWSFKLRNK